MATYKVLNGIDYHTVGTETDEEGNLMLVGHRVEPGDEVDDLPPDAIEWLLEGGHILDPSTVPPEPEPEPDPEHEPIEVDAQGAPVADPAPPAESAETAPATEPEGGGQ